MTSAWERLGRLLVEQQVLVAARSRSIGVLTPDEHAVLTGDRTGGDPAEVRAAFRPVLDEARTALGAELEGQGPLARIARYAHLELDDVVVLSLVAAADLDHETERLLGSPLTLAWVRSALGDAGATRLADDAALRRGALVEVLGTGPLGAAQVRLSRRTAWALIGDLSLDPDLPADTTTILAAQPAGAMRVLASGRDRVRRLEAAADATAGLGFLVASPPQDERTWTALVAQATTAGVGLVLDVPAAEPESPAPLSALTRRWLDRVPHLPVALCSTDPLDLELLSSHGWVETTVADDRVTTVEWKSAYGDAPLPPRRPSATQLQAMGVLDSDSPHTALRRLASGSLLRHARRVEARATWDDLILPESHERKLRSLVDRYRNRERVHHEWGLPLFPSPGIVALFSGSSGTGKTTSAEVIARELGVDLFRVDLSALVSKYIGETEKNLEEIFSAAHSGDYVLLFDEADSLFGSRSEVSDSRDRYANMEVSYLLQRLETYDGFVVLTSNFQGNIDDAFLRRIHATISFPLPSPEDRARIWLRSLAAAPLAELDLDLIATFELSGGSIRNAALTAAYLAAGRDVPVGMPELLAAVREELGKLRQRVGPQQFGPWADEVAEIG